MTRAVEIVRIRPKAGAESRLRELRPLVLAQYDTKYAGTYEAVLADLGDHWVDVWTWESRELAEEALSDPFPAFAEWVTLVEPLGEIQWGTELFGD